MLVSREDLCMNKLESWKLLLLPPLPGEKLYHCQVKWLWKLNHHTEGAKVTGIEKYDFNYTRKKGSFNLKDET